MSLPLELQIVLARLDADLCATRQSIQDLMECCFPQQPHGVGTVQYRALEGAIQQRRPPAVPETCSDDAAPVRDVSLGIDRWSLLESGWTLAFPDGVRRLALSTDERSILLYLAQSAEHRISRAELIGLVEPVRVRGTLSRDFEAHVRVVNRLRRRVRELGALLPLRAMRGGGYQVARPAAVSAQRRQSSHVAVRHGVNDPGGNGVSGAPGMSS